MLMHHTPTGILKNTPIGYSPLYMQRRTDLYPPESPDFPHVLTYYPVQWWPENMCRTAICVDGDGVYDCEDTAEV